MSEKESRKTQQADGPTESDNSQRQMPYEIIVSQIVAKIKNEPFLFVIAIVALLIGLAILATNLGSPDLRFIVVVIALLASTVILGYYILAGLKMRASMQQEAASRYQVDASRAIGVITGPQAKLEQHFGSPVQPPAPRTSMAGGFTPEQQRVALEQELSQHQRNLTRLRAKKGMFASGEEPLNLLNQIEAEEREIQRIQIELEQHSKG